MFFLLDAVKPMATNPLQTTDPFQQAQQQQQSIARVTYNGHVVDTGLGTVSPTTLRNMYGGSSGGGINPAMPTGGTVYDNSAQLAAEQAARDEAARQAARQLVINQQIEADRQAAQLAGQDYYPIYQRDKEGNALPQIAYLKKTKGGNATDEQLRNFTKAIYEGKQNVPVGQGTSLERFTKSVPVPMQVETPIQVYPIPTGNITGFPTGRGTVQGMQTYTGQTIGGAVNQPILDIQPSYRIFPRDISNMREGYPTNYSIGWQELSNDLTVSLARTVERNTWSKLPEGSILKNTLTSLDRIPSPIGRPSDVYTFAFFSPYMGTTKLFGEGLFMKETEPIKNIPMNIPAPITDEQLQAKFRESSDRLAKANPVTKDIYGNDIIINKPVSHLMTDEELQARFRESSDRLAKANPVTKDIYGNKIDMGMKIIKEPALDISEPYTPVTERANIPTSVVEEATRRADVINKFQTDEANLLLEKRGQRYISKQNPIEETPQTLKSFQRFDKDFEESTKLFRYDINQDEFGKMVERAKKLERIKGKKIIDFRTYEPSEDTMKSNLPKDLGEKSSFPKQIGEKTSFPQGVGQKSNLPDISQMKSNFADKVMTEGTEPAESRLFKKGTYRTPPEKDIIITEKNSLLKDALESNRQIVEERRTILGLDKETVIDMNGNIKASRTGLKKLPKVETSLREEALDDMKMIDRERQKADVVQITQETGKAQQLALERRPKIIESLVDESKESARIIGQEQLRKLRASVPQSLVKEALESKSNTVFDRPIVKTEAILSDAEVSRAIKPRLRYGKAILEGEAVTAAGKIFPVLKPRESLSDAQLDKLINGSGQSDRDIQSYAQPPISKQSSGQKLEQPQTFGQPQRFGQGQSQGQGEGQGQGQPQPYPQPQLQIFDDGSLRLKLPTGGRKKRRALRTVPTYSVQIRRRGKYIPIAAGLTRGQAIAYEQRALLQNIARTGKIVPMGTKEIFGVDEGDAFINKNLFRTYKVRQGKAIPLPFGNIVQLTSANLQSRSERAMLAEAKMTKKLMRGI